MSTQQRDKRIGLIVLDTNQKQNSETDDIDRITAKRSKESLPG